jgi:hypothetical protein
MEQTMHTQTLGSHQVTYDAVFQHPVARNLQWREVRAMLGHVSDAVVEEHGGDVKFTRNGQTLTVHPPRRKDFSDVASVMKVRHFLERSSEAPPSPTVGGDGANLLVVIDHREARIFRAEVHGTTPERITPLDPQGSDRYLHAVGDNSNGQRKPELKSFYEAIAKGLGGAEKILILGSSTGSSSAMDHLVDELKAHHPAVASNIVGAVVVDGKHMTDDQLLSQARTFFAPGPHRH